jgi:hypothetical protein
MNVREVLKTELWSKETTRKILVGIGAVVGLVFVGCITWYLVDMLWLTPGEREAARAALTEIDALRNASLLSDQEFKGRLDQANAKVKLAGEAAVTYRDNVTQMDLESCITGVDSDYSDRLMQRASEQGRLSKRWNRDREARERIESQLRYFARMNCLEIHKVLDR